FSPLGAYAAGPMTPAGDAFWAEVAESWLRAFSRPRRPAWHPYPTSVRILAWAGALSAIEAWPPGLRDRLAAALWRHARFLSRSVERDGGGNHVIKNAAALCAAGGLFPGSELLERGLELLRGELAAQLLADGGHEERSTAYQRHVRGDVADAARVLEAAGRPL